MPVVLACVCTQPTQISRQASTPQPRTNHQNLRRIVTVTDVAFCNGRFAVSVGYKDSTTLAQLPGRVFLFEGGQSPELLGSAAVGYLPDAATWNTDCSVLLAANEGEPNSYGRVDSFDPEGSISVVKVCGQHDAKWGCHNSFSCGGWVEVVGIVGCSTAFGQHARDQDAHPHATAALHRENISQTHHALPAPPPWLVGAQQLVDA